MLRSARERLFQAIVYEAGGLLVDVLAMILYAALFDQPAVQSVAVVAAVTVASLLWSPIHNTVFDMLDLKLSGRVASDRPQALRCIHAITHEGSSFVVTVPLVMLIGDHGVVEALAVDVGLSLLSAAYAYAFHLGYDWLRPVRQVPQAQRL